MTLKKIEMEKRIGLKTNFKIRFMNQLHWLYFSLSLARYHFPYV